jgi:hypothetical protein
MLPKRLLSYRQHAGASRVRFDLRSTASIRREMALAAVLQDNHPGLFAPAALIRRLADLPGRVITGRASWRTAALLVPFYGVMLARWARRRRRSGRESLSTQYSNPN